MMESHECERGDGIVAVVEIGLNRKKDWILSSIRSIHDQIIDVFMMMMS